MNEAEIIKLLFQNEKVPVWIDINVKTIRNRYTILNLFCAGRFSGDNEEYYYYENKNMGPFGIKSLELPTGFEDGDKFEI